VQSRSVGFACEKRPRDPAIPCPGNRALFNLESNVGSGLVSQFPRGARIDLCRFHPMCLQLAVTAGESCNIAVRAQHTTDQKACATGDIALRQSDAQYTFVSSPASDVRPTFTFSLTPALLRRPKDC